MKNFTLFCIMFFLVVSTYAQSSQARYHSKLQNERSYDTWEKNQPRVRIKAAKLAVEQSKDINNDRNKSARLRRKEDRITSRIIPSN